MGVLLLLLLLLGDGGCPVKADTPCNDINTITVRIGKKHKAAIRNRDFIIIIID